MISNLGELAGGEHYLAFLLILIVSCVLLSRNIMSERVDQGNSGLRCWSARC
uniref:Uncharacterized protein n=1 Tax=uncultured bacterium Contig27 TaxID=1393547 RepID=W0FNQ6_9BACT|nr:hypothetical protein [uncultured bacterium Contig27]